MESEVYIILKRAFDLAFIDKRSEKTRGILVRSDRAGHAHERFVPRCEEF